MLNPLDSWEKIKGTHGIVALLTPCKKYGIKKASFCHVKISGSSSFYAQITAPWLTETDGNRSLYLSLRARNPYKEY